MGVDNNAQVDLSSDAVRNFLCSKDNTYQQPDDADLIASRNLEKRATLPFPMKAPAAVACTILKKTYNIYKNNALLGTVSSYSPAKHTLDVQLSGVLLVLSAIAESKKKLIEDGFRQYDYKKEPDMQKHAQEWATRHGILSTEFVVTFTYFLTKTKIEFEDAQDKRLHELYSADLGYKLHLISQRCINVVDENDKANDNILEVPSLKDAEKIIEEELKKREGPCEGLEKVIKKIVQVGWYPEFKTETECHWERILCFDQRVCRDVIYARDANIVLYGTVEYRGVDSAFLKIFEHCLIESATVAAIIGIILENFAAALAAFRLLFIECVKRHVTELLECLTPDLFVVVERSNWRKLF